MTPTTSLGFSAVEFARDVLLIEPLPWQRWLLIHALELQPSGAFRFRTVLVMVARQSGKTSCVEIKNLWKMFVLRVPLVIGTAQNLDISEESWDKAVEIVESIPELAAEVEHVDKTNGKKALKLKGGPRWKIATASRKGGRGLSGDDVNLDELREHLTWDSWGAVTKTTMARANAQIWAYSNAGDKRSIVLNDLQEKGRSAAAHPELADRSLGHFEWSAPDDVRCTCGRPDNVHLEDCRLQDRRVWAMANPAMGHTITEEAIASALSTDPVAVFRTEVLCQRVEDLVESWRVLSEADWNAALDSQSASVGRIVFALAMTRDRSAAAIAVAGQRAEDGHLHAELVEYRPGTSWLVPRMVELAQRWKPAAVVADVAGPAGSIAADLTTGLAPLGLTLTPMAGRDIAAGYGMVHGGITSEPASKPAEWEPSGREAAEVGEVAKQRRLKIRPHPALTATMAGVGTRPAGSGTTWDDRENDVCTIGAVTNAVFGFVTLPPPEPDNTAPLVAWR